MKFSTEKPLVSVIVLCYNQAGIIGRAIQSVLDQTYPNIQLVIVDDCSKDDSKNVIESWYKKYPDKIKYFIQPMNVGHPANMNTGYKLCDGELVTFCDGDDWLFPESVNTQVNFLRTHPDYDVVYTNFSFHDMQGNCLKVWATDKNKIPSGDIFLDLFSLNYPGYVHPHFEMTFRKIIEETGYYDETIPIWVDWDFRLRLASKYKSGYCSYIGNAYTTHPGGLTNTLKRETYLTNLIKVIEKNKQYLSKYPPYKVNKAMKAINRHVKGMQLAVNFRNHQPSFINTVKYLAEYPQQITDWRFVLASMFGMNFTHSLSRMKQKFLGKRSA